MQRFSIFVFILILSAYGYSQDVIQTGSIHLSSNEINYGIINKDSDPYREITITNMGNYPLQINSCNASCGCTVPNCPVEPIPPKKKAVIRIRYNTSRIGAFNKTITVYSNDQKNPISLIKIFGEVRDTSSTN